MNRTRESHDADPEAAGAEYAQTQIESDYFMDWVREQLAEARRMDPSRVLPLETEADARVIAKNMLQQLKWDTSRDLDPREIARLIGVDDTTQEDVKEFFKGFRDTLDMNSAWLAGEILEINQEMSGRQSVHEPARNRRPAPGGALAGMSYEQILSLAHSHTWSPARDEAQAYVAKSPRRPGRVEAPRVVAARIKAGSAVTVIASDSMYRGQRGTVVELDARRAAKLDNFNRQRVRDGAVLVEKSDGSLFVVDSKELAFYTIARSAQTSERRHPKARRPARRR